jgi:hypothetical protein
MANKANVWGEWLFPIIYQLDEFGNVFTWHAVSDYGGHVDETWSSAMGKALAVDLYRHRFNPKYEPVIPRSHPVGKFFNFLCNLVQKNHSLKSIKWDEGHDLRAIFPGIEIVVKDYLNRK